MTTFDITSILEFQPPTRICPVCRGLFREFHSQSRGVFHCPVCSTEFVPGEFSDSRGGLSTWFQEYGYAIDQRNLLEHATSLARLVLDSRAVGNRPPWPTMRLLFEVLARARGFVHFASWGISHQFIGGLKLASVRVPVHGFVSNVEDHVRTELTEYPTEAPRFTAKVIPSKLSAFDAPHQKLVIIDGLLAFKGSMNLTNAGIRRADRSLDVSEVVTDIGQVTDLNNRYFSPVWKRINSPVDKFVVWDLPF